MRADIAQIDVCQLSSSSLCSMLCYTQPSYIWCFLMHFYVFSMSYSLLRWISVVLVTYHDSHGTNIKHSKIMIMRLLFVAMQFSLSDCHIHQRSSEYLLYFNSHEHNSYENSFAFARQFQSSRFIIFSDFIFCSSGHPHSQPQRQSLCASIRDVLRGRAKFNK